MFKALIVVFGVASNCFASDYSLSSHFGFNHFQQQVKSEIGGERGDRLVHQSELSSDLQFFYQFNSFLLIGGYLRHDIGNRNAGKFSNLDSENRAITNGKLGGDFWELWIGPVLKSQWELLFAELGYGFVGIRRDEGRRDVPDNNLQADLLFVTHSRVAWKVAMGVEAVLVENVMLSFKLEYRVRYYSSREGEDLLNGYEMGSQNVTPLIGVNYLF
jgi:opacity protein-like surface antigen